MRGKSGLRASARQKECRILSNGLKREAGRGPRGLEGICSASQHTASGNSLATGSIKYCTLCAMATIADIDKSE